jgi:acetylornithine deacetylase/succinyl-diaminopimelate desuccinylase-like protein
VGTIRGGDKVNIVADWCELELDFRFLPGMNTAVLLRTLKNIIRKNIKKFKVEVEGIQPPYVISEEHPLVEQLSQVLRKWNVKPVLKGSEGATVIAFFQEKGIAAVATGFGSSGCAHTADEYVRIGNLYKGAIILEEFLKNYRFS